MVSDKDELLAISGLQHFLYCPRQWALIHIEQQWVESYHTADGQMFHRKAHDGTKRELRGNILTVRGLPVASRELGVSGVCDVVEFRRCAEGISLNGETGLWQPHPVEYKRGRPKEHDADALQLCCQAMCLEQQLLCSISEGSLFYGETRRRERVEFTAERRERVKSALAQMKKYYERGKTPEPSPAKRCTACSLKDICLPKLPRRMSVEEYLRDGLEDKL